MLRIYQILNSSCNMVKVAQVTCSYTLIPLFKKISQQLSAVVCSRSLNWLFPPGFKREYKNVAQDGGPLKLIGGLRLVTATTHLLGVSMNMFDEFCQATIKDPVKHSIAQTEESIRTADMALKLHDCLETDYRSTVEFASIWNEISLRAAVKKDDDYASIANFISRIYCDEAVVIKAKADGPKLFVENEINQAEILQILNSTCNMVKVAQATCFSTLIPLFKKMSQLPFTQDPAMAMLYLSVL